MLYLRALGFKGLAWGFRLLTTPTSACLQYNSSIPPPFSNKRYVDLSTVTMSGLAETACIHQYILLRHVLLNLSLSGCKSPALKPKPLDPKPNAPKPYTPKPLNHKPYTPKPLNP